jgi:thiosulfate/3-mercaptopyruvate sulfurtransferase
MNHVAPRLWWVLRYYGHTNARVLNGDWHRWVSEGYPVTDAVPRPDPERFSVETHRERLATLEDVAEASRSGDCQILDTRSIEEYEGTNDRGNLRAGRVPGARHLEWKALVRSEGDHAFRSPDEMQSLVDRAGFDNGSPIITYCQGGIRAAHTAFALELLGYDDVRVYDGSMGEWANREDTPLER